MMTTRLTDLTVSVADILGQPGRHRDFAVAGRLPEAGTTLARLSATPVRAALRAESVVEGVLVTGRVEATTVLECARCLKDFDSEVVLNVCELFAAPGHEGDEDAYRVHGLEIDLEPMLRDAIVLELPLNPICRAACAGLCAQCGKDLNEGACDCRVDDTDPRWAALDALRPRLRSED